MTTFFFPDTTVLINFQIIQRWDLLEQLVGGRARWVTAVEDECRDWATAHPTIHRSARSVFGSPERPEGSEHQDIRVARDDMAAPYDPPRKHLGEAETLVIVERRFSGSYFMTDDDGARRAASARGIVCVGTLDLLDIALRRVFITQTEQQQCLQVLRANDRHPRSFH